MKSSALKDLLFSFKDNDQELAYKAFEDLKEKKCWGTALPIILHENAHVMRY